MGKGPKMRKSIFYALGIAAAAAVLFIGCEEIPYDLPVGRILTTDLTPPGSGTITRYPDYKSYSDSQVVAVTALPEKGYEFVEWEGSVWSTKDVISITMDDNKTLVAVFQKIGAATPSKGAYTITFNPNGGSVSPASAQTGTDGKLTPFSLPTPTRSDNSFKGWYTATTGGSAVTTSTVFNANATVYAQWVATSFPPTTDTTKPSPNAYTITFNPNSGTVSPTTATTGTDGKLAILPAPTRNGYAFNGWFTAATGGTEITTATVFTAKVTVYAQWTLITYTVTFDQNYTGSTKSTDVTGTGGKLASLPAPKRDGYTLKGWFTADTGGTAVTTSTVFDKNDTVYAQWTLVTYTVTFNVNGSGGTVSPTSAATGEGGKLAILPAPTRTGYAFNGWFTAATGGTAVTTSTVLDKNTTVYAQWTLITYTVTFKHNYTGSKDTTAITNASWKLASLPKPDRDGYEFKGWWTTATGGDSIRLDRVYSEDITVYARWQAEGATPVLMYTITFNANGGTGTAPGPQKTEAGYGITLPNGNGLTKANSTFGGWNTKNDGTGTNYNATDSYTPKNDVTLYAKWNAATTYTITFDANGGNALTPNTANTGADGKLASLPTPTRSGDYAFNGWFTAATGGTQITTGTAFTANATVYAQWEANTSPPASTTYTITFDANGGNALTPNTANTGTDGKLASLPTPTRSGYVFNGWFTAATGGSEVTTSTVFTANTTVYAQWTITYTITFNPNGGTVNPTSAKTGPDGKITPPLPAPEKSGYAFNGWFTAATGGDLVTINRVYTANATIYAQWTQIILYTVTFDANGGSGSRPNMTQQAGSIITIPDGSGMSKSGYNFDRWTIYSDGYGTNYYAGDYFTPISDTILYAMWAGIPTPENKGTFSDGRDSKSYDWVQIGTQKWMAENLNYDTLDSKCYDNDPAKCNEYGRLYDWATAMNIDASYNNSEWNGSDVNHQGVCPSGWHLPSDAEWTQLTDYVGGASIAGKKLKSTSGWNENGNGTDYYGFSALPGGYGESDSDFYSAGYGGYWWSATESYCYDNDECYARGRGMSYYGESGGGGRRDKTALQSVRCVAD